MRRFTFRLQSILELRRHEEEQRRLELGAITSRCAAISNEVQERRDRRRSILSTRPSEVTGDDIVWRSAVDAYALRLEAEAKRLSKQLAEAEKERTAAATVYREAKQKLDVLEKLRERREEAYRTVVKRDEQQRLDAVSQYMHIQGGPR